MSILIGADVVPTSVNEALFIKGDVQALLGNELTDRMRQADFRIINLEVPLTDAETPIAKCGPNLIAKPETIKGYVDMGINLAAVANNHILDQDVQGAISTLKLLDNAGIAHVGLGTPEEAAKTFYFTAGGVRYGVYACAEHEFTITEESRIGANPIDYLETPDHILQAKAQCDYLIVLYHGGKEYYRYPAPALQKLLRKLVEKGADLIVCQHSHCIGCEEKYLHGTILYGQGNFIFNRRDNEYVYTGLLLEVDGRQKEVKYLPIVRTETGTRLAEAKDAEEILSAFYERSEKIQKPGFIEQEYDKFADSMKDFYLQAFAGKRSTLFKVLDRLTKGKYQKKDVRSRYLKREKLRLLDFIGCEAHQELLLRGLRDEWNKMKKG